LGQDSIDHARTSGSAARIQKAAAPPSQKRQCRHATQSGSAANTFFSRDIKRQRRQLAQKRQCRHATQSGNAANTFSLDGLIAM